MSSVAAAPTAAGSVVGVTPDVEITQASGTDSKSDKLGCVTPAETMSPAIVTTEPPPPPQLRTGPMTAQQIVSNSKVFEAFSAKDILEPGKLSEAFNACGYFPSASHMEKLMQTLGLQESTGVDYESFMQMASWYHEFTLKGEQPASSAIVKTKMLFM